MLWESGKTYRGRDEARCGYELVGAGNVGGVEPERSEYGETSEAIYMNSGFCYESAEEAELRFRGEALGYVYARYGGPTQGDVGRTPSDDGRCRGLSGGGERDGSGVCFVDGGDSPGRSGGGESCVVWLLPLLITQILPRFQVETVLVDGRDLGAEKALGEKTAYVFLNRPPTRRWWIYRGGFGDGAEVGACGDRGQYLCNTDLAGWCWGRMWWCIRRPSTGQGRSLGGAILGGGY